MHTLNTIYQKSNVTNLLLAVYLTLVGLTVGYSQKCISKLFRCFVLTSFRVEKPDSLKYVDENWRRDLKEISANLGYSCLTFSQVEASDFLFSEFIFQSSVSKFQHFILQSYGEI